MAPRTKKGKGEKRTAAHDTLHKSDKNLGFAFQNRGSESALYGVYNHIISSVSNTITHPDFPHVTISHTPQAVLGATDMPVDQNGNPVTKDEIFNEQLPDFVRTFIKASEEKDQDGNRRYETLPVDLAAAKIMEGAIEQTWKQAMAAFAHNPGWQQIHVLLIVGVYFSQFKWMRPDGEIKRPLDDPPHVTKVLSGPELETLRKQYDDKIAQYQERPLPEIVYFNVPVFDFNRGGEERYQASLSPEFCYAMRLPLSQQQYPDCQYQRTWMSSPAKKPTRDGQSGVPAFEERAVMNAIRAGPASVSSNHDDSSDESWGGSNAYVEGLKRAAMKTPLAVSTRFGRVRVQVPIQSGPKQVPGIPASRRNPAAPSSRVEDPGFSFAAEVFPGPAGDGQRHIERQRPIQAIDFERILKEEYGTRTSSDESQARSAKREAISSSNRRDVGMHNEEDENIFNAASLHDPMDEDRGAIDDHVASPDTSVRAFHAHYDADSEGLGDVRHTFSDQAGTHPQMLSKDTKSRKKTLKHRKA